MTDLSKLAEVFSTATIEKAEKLVEQGGVERDPGYATIFWVKGSGGARYRLQVVEPFDEDETIGDVDNAETLPYVTCTCPNGLNASGRPHCYHAAAVIGLILADEENDFGEDDE